MPIESLAETTLRCLWRANWQAGVLAMLVLGLRWILGSRLSPRWRTNLWLIVLLRLALPALPSSPWSLFNLVPATPVAMPAEVRWPVETIVIRIAASSPLPAKTSTPMDWTLVLIGIWIAGVVGFGAWTLLVNIRFARRIRHGTEACEEMVTLLTKLAGRMKVKRTPRVVVTDAVSSPALFGLFRQRLLIPTNFLRHLTRAEVEFVLLHELAHVRRRDLAIGWITRVLRIVHWFNPLVWIFGAFLRTDAESACDEMVLSATDHDGRNEYGSTLLKLAGRFAPAIPSSALGVLDGKTELRHRLLQIVNFHRRTVRWSIAAAILLAVMAWLGLTDARNVAAQSPTTAASETPVARRYEVGDIAGVLSLKLEAGYGAKGATIERKEPASDGTQSATKVLELLRENTPGEWTAVIDARDSKSIGITVTAGPSVQARIKNVLDATRADRLVQVSVETRIFSMKTKDAEKLPFAMPGIGGQDPLDPKFLSQGQVDQIIRSLHGDPQATELTAPRLALWNHQKSDIKVETDQDYVESYSPATQPSGEVSYHPNIVRIADELVRLQCRPAVSTDHKTVLIDWAIKFSRLLSLTPAPFPGHKEFTIQVPKSFDFDMRVSQNVKDRQTAVYCEGIVAPGHAIFVSIKPTVIETPPSPR